MTVPDAIDWSIGPGAPLILLLALVLDALIGDPRWFPHPIRLIGWLTGFLEKRLNRERRSATDRVIRGLITVLLVVGLSTTAGWAIVEFVGPFPFGWTAELALVTLLIAQRNMADHMVRVGRALRRGGLKPGRDAVRHIVGRDVQQLDEHGVARAAIESCAENYSDGVVAPIFWYLLLGLPGLVAYKAINTLDSMIGHRTPRYRAFGLVAARLDDAVNWMPARISGLLVAIAALFLPGASPWKALRTMFRDAGKHISPNAGWPEAAMAGALGLALLGPRRYDGEAAKGAWLGDGRARATPADMRRALYLFAVACVLGAAIVAAIGVALTLYAG